jgi:hypothetical protein
MLLETLDIKKDDIVIFSQNLFNLDNNFRIIYKDDENKECHKISYKEVCRFVNEFTPKNLIVYRLLTNINSFEIIIPKYGFFLNINGITELIFFDPIYAVRELEESPQGIDYDGLRFRIQQIGLTTLNRKGDLPNYAEIYSIDLEASEAKFQNDKAFADAIFSTNKNIKSRLSNSDLENNLSLTNSINKNEKPGTDYGHGKKTNRLEPNLDNSNSTYSTNDKLESNDQKNIVKSEQEFKSTNKKTINNEENEGLPDDEFIEVNNNIKKNELSVKQFEGMRIVSHDISEDKNFNYKEILKINIKGNPGLNTIKNDSDSLSESRISLPQQQVKDIAPAIHQTETKLQSQFGNYLKNSINNKIDKKIVHHESDEKVSQVLNMFKSSSSLNEYLNDRSGKQIVLKLNN